MGERRQRADGGGWAPTGGLAGSTRLQPHACGRQLAWGARGAPWEPAMTCSTLLHPLGRPCVLGGSATAGAAARRARSGRRAHLGALQRTDGRHRRPQAAHGATTRKTIWGLSQLSVALRCCHLSTAMLPASAVQVSPVIPCTSAAPRAASRRHGARSGSESAPPCSSSGCSMTSWRAATVRRARGVALDGQRRSAAHTTRMPWPRSLCLAGLRPGPAPLLLLL